LVNLSLAYLLCGQIAEMEEALRARESGLKEEHASHEDALTKLSTLTKERELSWSKQKHEMETHYQGLLAEMQARIKVTLQCLFVINSVFSKHFKVKGVLLHSM